MIDPEQITITKSKRMFKNKNRYSFYSMQLPMNSIQRILLTCHGVSKY